LTRLTTIILFLFLFSCTVYPVETGIPATTRARQTTPSTPLPSPNNPHGAESSATRRPPERASPEETTHEDKQPSATLSRGQSPCPDTRGTIENGVVESELLDYDLKFRIYLPPCYTKSPEAEYPTLYLFHGKGYRENQWDELGADEIADKLINSDQVEPFIMVMPREQMHNNSKADPFAQAVLQELLPFIENNYRTVQEREKRAVGGISRGGGWALEMGLHNWEYFGSLGAHSPAVLNNNPARLEKRLESIPASQIPRIFIDLGDREPQEISESAGWLGELLNQNGIPHEWHQFTGEHNQEYWRDHLEIYLRWYASAWF